MSGNLAQSDTTLIRSRYQVLEPLGHGGLGTVFYGWDSELERAVAIKRLYRNTGGNQNIRDEGWREARTMAALQHANIVTLYDFGEDEEGPFFIMEFINGHTLDQLADPENLPGEENLVEITRQILKGLSAAHEKGIIHRDMKATNVMVTHTSSGDPDVKILDFGLARFQQQPTEQTLMDDGSFMGSVFYAAPEQLNRKALDQRTDLYSLGHVIFHYATGRTAFNGDTIHQLIAAHLTESPPSLADFRPDLNESFVQWIHWLMQNDPVHRPDTSQSALDSLKGITGLIPGQTGRLPLPETIAPPPVEPAPAQVEPAAPGSRPVFTLPSGPPPSQSFPWVWTIAGTCAFIAIAAVIYLTFFSKKETAPPSTSSVPTAITSVPAPSRKTEIRNTPDPANDRSLSTPPPPREATARVNPQPRPESSAATATANPTTRIWDPKEIGSLAPYLGQPITIEGIPIELGENRSGTAFYLNFTREYRKSVALVMFLNNDPSGFTRSNLEPMVGQKIRVSGILDEYRGAYQIKLNNLSEIKTVRK